MTEEEKEKFINRQSGKIKTLTRENQRLNRRIEELENELYKENNTRANNHKVHLRVKDIINMYPVGKSTVWLYAKQGNITPIKNSSRVTTFDAKEVQRFFKSINKEAYDITPKPLDAAIAKIRQKPSPVLPKFIKKIK